MADQNRILLTTAPGVDGFRVARTLNVIMGGGMFEQRLFGDNWVVVASGTAVQLERAADGAPS